MTKDEFITLKEEAVEQNGEWSIEQDGEWSREDAIEMSFMEAGELAKAVAEYRKLKQIRELIEKPHQERSNENDQ
jgi:NTP pyrophosphatase (non-canonical NTP hydrolase)